MNILIIGATRGLGLSLVNHALDHGHRVTGLARDPMRHGAIHRVRRVPGGSLSLFGGDIVESGPVAEAVEGQDAVCITIGVVPTRDGVDVFSKGTATVIEAMNRFGVKRLVCVTGIGAGDSRGHGGFFHDRIVQPLLLRQIYEDKDRQESVVRASDVAWTLVRPGFLTNGPRIGRVRVVSDMQGVVATKVSRKDLAGFLLREMTSPEHVGKAVFVDSSKAAQGETCAID